MNYFRQSTSASFRFGPFVSDSDGYTPVTDLSISASDVRISKNGGDFAAKNNSTSGVYDEKGYYQIIFDTTDTNTAGSMRVSIDMTDALPVWEDFTVLHSDVYDSLIVGTSTLDTVMTSATSAGVADILGTSADTKTLEEIFEIMLSMASGRVVRNGNVVTYYKQDGTTELFTLQSAKTERSRL